MTQQRKTKRLRSRGGTASERPLWRCPKCEKTFITRNMWHSCRRYDMDALFAKCEPHVRGLFEHMCRLVAREGPVTLNPGRRAIAFQVRVRAFGVVPRRDHLEVGFAFRKVRSHPRCFRTRTYTPEFHAHWVRVHAKRDFDARFRSWLQEAYARAAQR